MQEKRSSGRQKSFLQGRIFFNHRRNSIDCLIRDISDQGAKLKFSGTIATPEFFELYIPNKEETYRARVQWRAGDEIGVMFEDAERAPSLVPGFEPEWTARIRKLEHDVAVLQRKFNDLQANRRRITGVD